MVQLYRTFSNLIFTVVRMCVGYLYTVSEWFNPPRLALPEENTEVEQKRRVCGRVGALES